jgi:hypothetical protein
MTFFHRDAWRGVLSSTNRLMSLTVHKSIPIIRKRTCRKGAQISHHWPNPFDHLCRPHRSPFSVSEYPNLRILWGFPRITYVYLQNSRIKEGEINLGTWDTKTTMTKSDGVETHCLCLKKKRKREKMALKRHQVQLRHMTREGVRRGGHESEGSEGK